MLRPDYKEFARLSQNATLVPVAKTVTADLLTPVSAFLAVAAKASNAFLLESVEGGEKIGRHTFLGADPYMKVSSQGARITLERGNKREQRTGDIFQVVKELLRAHRPATLEGLPPFTAGAVGYFAYDVVRQLENVGEHAKDDLFLPDCVLMFFDRLLVFDHLRHQIHIIATADVSKESPRKAYDRALEDIAILKKKLVAGLRHVQWQKEPRTRVRQLRIHAGMSRERFMQHVKRANEYSAAGDIFQVVLS